MRSQYGEAPVALKKKPAAASGLATSNLNADEAEERTTKKYEENAPEVEAPEPRTWGGELKRAFLPWDPVDFEGCTGKIFAIIMAPCYFLVKISVCVVDDNIETWNYPLAIVQMFASERDRPIFNSFCKICLTLIVVVHNLWMTDRCHELHKFWIFDSPKSD